MDTNHGSASISRNVVYGFTTWLLPIILGFIATPVIVRSLGNHEYGIYALVLGFIAYSFNFNLGRAITKYVAEYRASGDTHKIRDIISATLVANIALGLLSLLIIVILSESLVTQVFQLAGPDVETTVTALRISALVVFVLIVTQVFNAILQGLHRFDVFSKLQNANSILLLIGNLFLAINGFGLLALLYWSLAASAVACVFAFFATRRLLPEFQISLRFSSGALTRVLRYSAGVAGYQLIGNALLLFERGWITSKLGTESLTYYVVPMLLALNIHSLVGSLTLVIFPLASQMENERAKLYALYKRSTRVVGALVAFMAITMIVVSEILLTLWIGPDFGSNSAELLVLHTLTFSFAAVFIISFQVAEGLGFPGFNFAATLLSFMICIPAMVLLSPDFGNLGVAAGRLLGFFAMFLSTFYLQKWAFGTMEPRFWIELIASLLIAGGAAAAAEYFTVYALPISWISLTLAIAIGFATYIALLFLIGFFTPEDRVLFLRAFRR
ncbi:MAG: oligosaccharide flippase family protein [Pyrinomonadaceae bacterium]